MSRKIGYKSKCAKTEKVKLHYYGTSNTRAANARLMQANINELKKFTDEEKDKFHEVNVAIENLNKSLCKSHFRSNRLVAFQKKKVETLIAWFEKQDIFITNVIKDNTNGWVFKVFKNNEEELLERYRSAAQQFDDENNITPGDEMLETSNNPSTSKLYDYFSAHS